VAAGSLINYPLTKPQAANNCWYLCWYIQNHKIHIQAMTRHLACFGVVGGEKIALKNRPEC
jgi:hypothetical protein